MEYGLRFCATALFQTSINCSVIIYRQQESEWKKEIWPFCNCQWLCSLSCQSLISLWTTENEIVSRFWRKSPDSSKRVRKRDIKVMRYWARKGGGGKRSLSPLEIFLSWEYEILNIFIISSICRYFSGHGFSCHLCWQAWTEIPSLLFKSMHTAWASPISWMSLPNAGSLIGSLIYTQSDDTGDKQRPACPGLGFIGVTGWEGSGKRGSELTDRRPAQTFFKPSKSSFGNWKWQWAVSEPAFACQRRRVWIYLTCFCPDKSLMCQPWQITCKCCFFIPRRWDDLRALPREIKL